MVSFPFLYFLSSSFLALPCFSFPCLSFPLLVFLLLQFHLKGTKQCSAVHKRDASSSCLSGWLVSLSGLSEAIRAVSAVAKKSKTTCKRGEKKGGEKVWRYYNNIDEGFCSLKTGVPTMASNLQTPFS